MSKTLDDVCTVLEEIRDQLRSNSEVADVAVDGAMGLFQSLMPDAADVVRARIEATDEPAHHHECGGNVELNLIGDDVYDIVMTCAGCGQRAHGIASISGGGR